jgi:hypothetical protein
LTREVLRSKKSVRKRKEPRKGGKGGRERIASSESAVRMEQASETHLNGVRRPLLRRLSGLELGGESGVGGDGRIVGNGGRKGSSRVA